MTTTAIERRAENGRNVALFAGANADEILAVAADVATKFNDIVRKQRMFKRIGESDHIQIEAWQTIGALTGVVAAVGEVEAQPWPHSIAPLWDEPPVPGPQPRNRDSQEWATWKLAKQDRQEWEAHRQMLRDRDRGRTFGFIARFTATKYGEPQGWGEGSVDRNELNWVGRDDHELRAMAETRGQSRALGTALKFVVKLAGYETTPVEELDGSTPAVGGEQLETAQAAAQKMGERVTALERELTAAHEALAKAGTQPAAAVAVADDEAMQQAANMVRALAAPAEVDGEKFIVAMGQHFDGVPESCVTMLRGLVRFIGASRAEQAPPENAPPDAEQSAYHQSPGPSDADVYPPGPGGTPRYQGD